MDDNAFSHCPVLEFVYISDNDLIILPDASSLSSLIYIVGHNNILYIQDEYFSGLNSLEILVLDNSGLNSIPSGLPSQVTVLHLSGNRIESAPDLSQLSNLVSLELDEAYIQCDWRVCWLLFEAFDPFLLPSYRSPGSGSIISPQNDLDPTRLRCPNQPHTGTLLIDITPLELACFESKFCDAFNY